MTRPLMRFPKAYEAGDAWLADCSAHPDLVREAWDLEALAPIRSGTHWRAAEMPLITAMQLLTRIAKQRQGPVLAEPSLDTAWWLVPAGAAQELSDVRSVRVHAAGEPLHCPPTGWHACVRFWLSRPDGSGRLTDPVLLAAALGPGHWRPTEATT